MSFDLDLARQHAPLLLIVAPLIGAALTALAPGPRVAWTVASLAALLAAGLALDLAAPHLLGDAAYVNMSEAIALRQDGVGVFCAALLALAAALIVLGAGAVLGDYPRRAAAFVLALLLAMSAGWTGALFAEGYVGVFLSVETAWLAGVGLVSLFSERERGALNGAWRMLSAGGVSSALMLLGFGLIAHATGSWALAALASATIVSPALAGVGAGLVIVALAIKAGVAPFHVWMGAAFGRSGGLGAFALGAIGIVGALAVMLRLAGYALAAPSIGSGVSAALVAIGVTSVVLGSFQAIGATNLRRLGAYAGAAQAGSILLTAALGSPVAFSAALVQLFGLAASAIALLGGAAALGAITNLNAFDGLSRRAPLASLAIMIGALSLMGAPLTIGFLGRWRLIEAGVGAGWWWATGAVIAASLAAVFYAGRLIERIYFRRAGAAFEGRSDLWRLALAPALLAAIFAIALGLEPSLLLRASERAAALLLGEAA